ncbi:hypothetical protein [Pontivivens ytuae]|uniref:Co-chaperone DjlA N-terminal domain-containing protein n=1 Tax=Pontivivens ytuae TaxID=2789856 RepID=A0A7S9LRK6_9RHOB|nr:hypothetical protein [Pontivivens ytuae]QPH54002.1 hypothetical protein I0K15_19890 [Pontivivens ytuae]
MRLRITPGLGRDLIAAARDVRTAAQRFGYRQHADVHPGDSVDDPRIAATGLLIALSQSQGGVSAPEMEVIHAEVQRVFDIDSDEADELISIGRWLVEQCEGPHPAMHRLARRLRWLSGPAVLPDLVAMSEAVSAAAHRAESDEMGEAIADIRRVIAH